MGVGWTCLWTVVPKMNLDWTVLLDQRKLLGHQRKILWDLPCFRFPFNLILVLTFYFWGFLEVITHNFIELPNIRWKWLKRMCPKKSHGQSPNWPASCGPPTLQTCQAMRFALRLQQVAFGSVSLGHTFPSASWFGASETVTEKLHLM